MQRRRQPRPFPRYAPETDHAILEEDGSHGGLQIKAVNSHLDTGRSVEQEAVTRSRSGGAVRVALWVHLVLCVAVVAFWQFLPSSDLDPHALLYPLSLAMLSLFVWTCWSWWYANGTLLDPYGFFLIGLWLFNAGQVFLEVFRQNPAGILAGLFSASMLLTIMLFVAVILMATHLGALASLRSTSRHRPAPSRLNSGRSAPWYDGAVTSTGWILFAVSLPFFIQQSVQAYRIVSASGYLGLYADQLAHPRIGAAGTPAILANFFLPAAYFLLANKRASRWAHVVGLVSVLGYAGTEILLGLRYPAFMSLIILLWLLRISGRRVARGTIVWAGFVTLLISPAIGVFRGAAGAQRLDPQILLGAFNHVGNPIVNTVSEMGSTMQITGDTFLLVPSQRGYDWGMGYLGSLSSAFPNVFWSVHPGHIYVYGDWLTQSVIPLSYLQGIGLGFSYVAETYINFGLLLAPLMAILIGFLYARLSVWGSRSTDCARWAATACLCFGCSEWGRAEAFNVFRSFFWYALGPYLLVLLVRYNYRRTHPVAQLGGHTDEPSRPTRLSPGDAVRRTRRASEASYTYRLRRERHAGASDG